MKITITIIGCLLFQLCLNAQSIHRTACNGNMARLDSLLTNNTINVKDHRGRSLLHWAVACKKKDIFDFLIEKGIDLNGTDHQEKTPMHIAVGFDNKEYLDHLIALQPDTHWQSRFGASLLEVAIMKKNKLLIEALVASGVDINTTNQRGSTPLEISQRIGALDIYNYLISLGADKRLVRTFNVTGEYMGQQAPGITPRLFAPNFISTEEQEFGSVFNKKGTEFFFGVDVGGRNEIRFSKMVENQWTKPITILSHERYSYNDPFLSNDEERLYFISKRALDGKGEIKDVDIWYVERTDKGWSEPINAGSTINTKGDEYYISFTREGTLYFASNGHSRQDSTRTDHDIYYSKNIDHKFQKPVLLDEAVNTTNYEADVFVAPDESYIIFCSVRDEGFGRGDLYISFKNTEGNWITAINMGEQINTKHYEYCPYVTPDGNYIFYTSNQDIYWVSTEIIDELKKKI